MGVRLDPVIFDLFLHYVTQELNNDSIQLTYYADNGYWVIKDKESEVDLRLMNNRGEEKLN